MSWISDQDIDAYRELGYFVTPVAVPEATRAAMIAETDRVYEEGVRAARREGPEAVARARGRRSYGQFHARSPVAARLAKEPLFLEACRRLIGPDADLYWNQAAVKPPKIGKVFTWHQDSGYSPTTPLEHITCYVAITDNTRENGCVWVIPGSHKAGLLEHFHEAEDESLYDCFTARFEGAQDPVPLELEAGQVAVFSSLLLHMSGPNTTADQPRYAFIPQYHVPRVVKVNGDPVGDRWPVLRGGERVE